MEYGLWNMDYGIWIMENQNPVDVMPVKASSSQITNKMIQ